jgi:hypothetical protein
MLGLQVASEMSGDVGVDEHARFQRYVDPTVDSETDAAVPTFAHSVMMRDHGISPTFGVMQSHKLMIYLLFHLNSIVKDADANYFTAGKEPPFVILFAPTDELALLIELNHVEVSYRERKIFHVLSQCACSDFSGSATFFLSIASFPSCFSSIYSFNFSFWLLRMLLFNAII